MPQLPTAASLGERPEPRPQTAVTEIRPGAVEAAVATAGDAIVKIDEVITKTRRTLQLSEALGKATEQLGEKALQYERDQDFRTSPQRFRSDANGIGQEVGQSIDDPFVRRIFTERFTPLAVAQQLQVTKYAAKQEIDFSRAALTESLGKMALGMANAEDPFLRKTYQDMAATSIGEMRANGVISDGQALEISDNFYKSYFLTKTNKDPVVALRELKASGELMNPLTAAQLRQNVMTAAKPVLANDLVQSMKSLSFTSVTPAATPATMEALRAAIFQRESGGDPEAVSVQGARGKAQIMRPTFEQYAQPGESFDNEEDRVRAADRKLLDDWTFFKGDVKKVAAAYLGGRGAVRPDGTLRDDVADKLGTTPAAYAAQVEQLMGGMRQAVINQSIIGPNGAFEQMIRDPQRPTGNPDIDELPLDEKIAVLQMARTQAQQGQSQVKASVASEVSDAIAMLRDGRTPTNVPTGDKILAAAGPVDGMRMLTQLDQAKRFGEDVRSVQSLGAREQLDLLQRRMQELPDGPGYADGKRLLDQLGEAVSQVQRQREQNPAGTVLQNSPATRALFDAAGGAQDGADRARLSQEYAASTLGEQDRLGIANRAILTPQQVAAVASEFAKPGNDAARAVDGLADQWGKYFPQVMRELRKSLPPNAVTIALGVKPEMKQLLSEGAKLKPEQLQQGFADTDIKALTDAITKKFEPMRQTVAASEGGVETYDSYADSAKTAALMMMQQGMKPAEAVDKAFEGMLGYKYVFDGRLRVPKAALGGNVTVPNILAGGRAMVFDVAARPDLAVPDSGVPGMRPEDAEKQWRETLKYTGTWLTSPGDQSATLHFASGAGYQVVLDKSGQPIRATWNQMANTSTELLPTFFDAANAARMRGGPGPGAR